MNTGQPTTRSAITHPQANLFSLFLELRQVCQHILHVVDAGSTALAEPRKRWSVHHVECQPLCKSPPSETGIFLHEGIEVAHEHVDAVLHMQMSNLRPDLVLVG